MNCGKRVATKPATAATPAARKGECGVMVSIMREMLPTLELAKASSNMRCCFERLSLGAMALTTP